MESAWWLPSQVYPQECRFAWTTRTANSGAGSKGMGAADE